jgi:hypothetical protein
MNCSFKRLMAAASMVAMIVLAASEVSRAQMDGDAPTPPPLPRVIPVPPTAPTSPSAPAGNSELKTPNVMDGCACGCGGEATCSAEAYCCRHLYASAEVVWLAPCENQRSGSFDIFNINNNVVYDASAASAANEGLVATPRLTVGIQGECWGVQARYWRMSEPNTQNTIDLASGQGMIASAGFFAETLDVEVTRLLCLCDTQSIFTFGACYAQLNQSVGLYANQFEAGDFYSGSVLSGVEFAGAGLTSSLSGYKPVGCGNFNLFYGLRASILWDGNASNYVQTRADYESPVNGFSQAFNAARAGDSSNLFIGEIQLGGQWNFALKCLPAEAFIRLAFEYQYWAVNDSGDARALSFAGPLNGAFAGVAAGRSSDAFVNLVGFSVGTGITW